jgi:DNA repair exonuclease SbcCD ATPase subunit
MININFEKIKIKNFLSVGSIPVVVDFKPGLHIITGINKDKEDRRNGVGKSTIADAIYFAVFGETLRDLKKDHIINNVNKKNCEVELLLTIRHFDLVEHIKIVRTLDPSKCYLYINDEDKTRDSISNTTDFILKKLSCTPEIFQNCVIMTINNTIPFMAKKRQEKRKFIEDIFNLSIFSEMLNMLKADTNEKKKEFDIALTRYDEANKGLTSLEEQHKNAAADHELKKKKYQERKQNNKKEIAEIEQKLKQFTEQNTQELKNKIKDLQDGIKKIDNKLIELRNKKTENTLLIQQLSKKSATIGTEAEKCPVCLRSIEEHDKNHIKSEKQKIKVEAMQYANEIKTLEKEEKTMLDQQQKITKKVQEINTSIHSYELKQQEKTNNETRLSQLKQWLTMLDQDIKELNQTTCTANNIVEEQKKKIAYIKEEIEKYKKDLHILDVVKFVVSEEGVKSYVVKKILQLFNSKLAYYLKKMDANCICSFNEYFEEEIIDNKGKPCSYFNFSGAERKNIDLACLFTFMDMRRLQGDVSFNFSIYDELFDSSLDEKGVELVINILKERVEKFNESIMVISHRKESIKAATGDIIFLEKLNGITKRVDFKEYPVKL